MFKSRFFVVVLLVLTGSTQAQSVYCPPETQPTAVSSAEFWTWNNATDDWFGARSALETHGISLASTLLLDWSEPFAGGATPHAGAFRYLWTTGLTLDTAKLFALPGGTFYAAFQMHRGTHESAQNVGDLQAFDNMDADGRTQISEVWYQQTFLDDKLRIKIGKMDANCEFLCNTYGAGFINSSFGKSPTSLGIPSYPDPAMGVVVFVKPTDRLYVGGGFFDGSGNTGIRTGSYGPAKFFTQGEYFVIGEVGLTWALGEHQLAGRGAIGGWGHTGNFTRFDGSPVSGTEGFYLCVEQLLWRVDPQAKDDQRGVGLLLQYGYADAELSSITHHFGAAVAATGLIPARDRDVMGVGVTWAGLTDDANAGFTTSSETAVEVFYKISVTPWLFVQPDLQYIFNPGGNSAGSGVSGVSGVRDAVVGTLRVGITF